MIQFDPQKTPPPQQVLKIFVTLSLILRTSYLIIVETVIPSMIKVDVVIIFVPPLYTSYIVFILHMYFIIVLKIIKCFYQKKKNAPPPHDAHGHPVACTVLLAFVVAEMAVTKEAIHKPY